MATPTKWGGEFLADTSTAKTQTSNFITALDDGRFVISYADYDPEGLSDADIRAQIFNGDGTKSGPEFPVSATTTSDNTLDTI